MSDIKYSELETLKTEMKSKEEKLQKDEGKLSGMTMFVSYTHFHIYIHVYQTLHQQSYIHFIKYTII